MLPDGSSIALGVPSSVAVEYATQVRRIVLNDGEALFRVAKNPSRPFIVEAAGGSAQALGTVFNVHRGPEGVTVGVAEGVVQVRAAANAAAPAVRLPAGNEVRPESRGELKLRSADPTAPPIINANYLAHERDREALRSGVRIARDIIGLRAYAEFRGREVAPGAACVGDSQLDDYFRETINPNYEAVGTCKMGNDDLAVVNDRLQVHGIEGLRVVDGSVRQRITTGDPSASIIMIAEKAAELITKCL